MRSQINDKISCIAWWALFVIMVGVAIFIRLRLLQLPLERDEGEYAYAGQLMLEGVPPYKLAYNMKLPGTYAAYALIMSIFGQTIAGIHAGLLLVNAATLVLIFCLGRRLVGPTAGISAAAAYAVLSVSPSVLGLAAHATHFVMLPVLAGALLLLRASDRQAAGTLFASGILFGIGLLMKQPALFFVLFGLLYLVCSDLWIHLDRKRIFMRAIVFVSGAITPLGMACFSLWWAGVFEKFWFWTIDYAGEYSSLISFSSGFRAFLTAITAAIGSGWALWILAGFGAIECLSNKSIRAEAAFLLGFLAFSGLALCPGFHFRPHYFIFVLPAICLLAGVSVASAGEFCARYSLLVRLIPLVLFGTALTLPLFVEREFFFAPNPVAACRMVYAPNPFPEALRIAEYLKEHTTADDRVAVLGSEPEIYFYSHRRSATGYIYTYALMELHKYARQMQGEMIQEIERARPKFVIFVGVPRSWLKRPQSERTIFDWADRYCAQEFTLVGRVNISLQQTDYYFSEIPKSVEAGQEYILIFGRNP